MKLKYPSKKDIYAVILAGGKGTRLWPLSRKSQPKQFLAILDNHSLLQETVKRVKGLTTSRNILIVTNEKQAPLVRKQLPRIKNSQILIEPSQQNTAAAIALAAHEVIRKNSKAIMVILPSDHLIRKVAVFRQAILTACRVARVEGNSVLLGVPPSCPEISFGYLKLSPPRTDPYGKNIRTVESFTEKPDLKTAKHFVASGQYVWNTGIFVWKASTFLDNLARFLPLTANAFGTIGRQWGKAGGRKLLREIYPRLKNISVDYGIMEKATDVYSIPRDLGWSDVGTWASAYKIQPKDRQGNSFPDSHFSLNSKGNYISSSTKGKFVAALGIQNLIVVDTPDILLICHRDHSQYVGEVVKKLKEKRQDYLL